MSKRTGEPAFWGGADDAEARERYRTLVNAVDDGICQLDAEGRFVAVNDAIVEGTGREREDLLGAPVGALFEAEDAPAVEREIERLRANPEASGESLVLAVETESDARAVWELRVNPVVEDGAFQGAIGIARDVTERNRPERTDRNDRERELERKERRFEAVFEDPNILVGLLEPDGTVLDINRTAMEYVEDDLDSILGEPFWETPWWSEEVRADVKRWTERAADGEYVEFEADLTRPDGERYVLEGYFRPVTNDDGEVVSVIVSDRDITERVEHERALAESEQRYRALAEHFPNGIVTRFDDDLTYTLAAGQAFDRIPVEPAELEGEHFRDVWDDETAETLAPLFQAALDGRERSVEVSYAGREWVVRSVPITDEHGEVFAGMTMAQDITERKEQERELAKYGAIVETMDDGIYVKDEDGRFTMVNDAYAELTGYDREELVGEHASLVVDEEAMERSRDARTGDDAAAVEATLRTADGATVPAEGVFSTLRTPDGERKEVGVVRDITERKEQRRRIEASERRYRTLVENFPNGAVGLFDEDLRYTAVGGQLAEEVEPPTEAYVGERVSDIYPDELVDQVEPYFRAALDGETNVFEVEYHGRHLLARTLPVGDGEVSRGMLVVQDVSERREAERERRESEAKLRMLAENLDQIVWMATGDLGEFVYINPAFEELWGMTREQLYEEPRSFLDAVHADDRERVREAFEALPEREFDEEFRVVQPDGEVRWIHTQGARVHDEDEGMTRVIGTGEDVTERVERERELEESERRYRALAENFPNGAVGLVDEDLRYMTAGGDPLTERELTSEELEGRRVGEVLSPALADRLEPNYRAALDGESNTFEYEHGDGERYVTFRTFPVRDSEGEVFAAMGMSQDVTELRVREQSLRRLHGIAADSELSFEEKVQALFELGCERFDMELGGIASVDPETDRFEVEAVSGAHEHLRPGEQYPLSETYCRAVTADREMRAFSDPEAFEDNLCYERFGARSYLGTYLELEGTDDRTFWFVSSEPREEPFSEAERMFHHQMAQWLRYEFDRRRHTDQLAAVNRLNAVARDINRELARRSTREEIEAVVCERLAESASYEFAWIGSVEEGDELALSTAADGSEPLDGDPRIGRGLAEAALRTGQLQVVRNVERGGGSERPFDSAAAIPLAYEEQRYGVLNVYSSRTNAFDGEEREVVGQLGEIVGLAIAAIEREAKLQHERERLELVNRLLRHNLLNGLNLVGARLDMLAGHVDAEALDHLDTARNRTGEMTDLIETLRTLTEDLIVNDYEPERVDLGRVLGAEVDRARAAYDDAVFDVRADLDAAPPVLADDLLEEVFENLLGNAVRHNDKDRPRVAVDVTTGDGAVTVHVSDNGPGVPEQMRETVFEKGEKGFESPGTGFGLYLVREIVNAYDGAITIEDNDPEGTVFSVSLPVAGTGVR